MRWISAIAIGLLVGIAVLLISLLGVPNTASAQPPSPHPITPGMDCLSCHGPGSAQAMPASHTGLSINDCTNCHEEGASAETAPTPSPTASPVPAASNDPGTDCLTCHGNTNLVWKMPGGQNLSLFVDKAQVNQSVHGDKLTCQGCHTDIKGYPHPTVFAMDHRAYSLTSYELCKGCHFDQYTKALDSVHYKQLAGGNQDAPVCTDCHGSHDVSNPQTPRAKISQTCAKCHYKESQDYASSVHGKALQDGNQDVPVCTDCHGVHNIQDPRTATFRTDTPDMCSSCHNDEKLMSKYGISNMVEKTYLEDFHGVTVNFYKKEGSTIWPSKAVCTDCHGIHDIQPADSPDSPVIKANLVATCRQCHPQATTNFPDAWLQHYEPTPQKWPVVYYARLFYNIIIPLTVGGLLVHIGLDLTKTMLGRVRRRK